MTDDDLMALYMDLIVWVDYFNGRLALAEINENDATAQLGVFEARYFKGSWDPDDKDAKVTAVKAMREADPAVIEEREKKQHVWAYRKLVDVLYRSAERDAAAISRELSRRIGMGELEGRQMRLRP